MKRIVIGTLVQWYEVDIISNYIDSLHKMQEYTDALELDDPVEILYDFVIYDGQHLESFDVNSDVALSDIIYKIESIINSKLKKSYILDVKGQFEETPYSISDYRRDLGNKYCNQVDVICWGETDAIFPKEYAYLVSQDFGVDEFVVTFATCKMWDSSWHKLEHPKFRPFEHEKGTKSDWWNLNYVMSWDEMNTINQELDIASLKHISNPKFSGCGPAFSSRIFQRGINIPPCVFFVHEDTAMLEMIKKQNIPQLHYNNCLLVHNRKDPNKRGYIDEPDGSMGEKRNSHEWYKLANQYSMDNLTALLSFNKSYKFKTWKDVIG